MNKMIFSLVFISITTVVGCGDGTVTQTEVERPIDVTDDSLFAGLKFSEDDAEYDLSRGEFLVAVLSATCDHCQKSVPIINESSATQELPQVIGLVEGDETSLDNFVLTTNPAFPCFLIDIESFFNLIESAPPRLLYVQDGKILNAWDGDLPGAEIVVESLVETHK